MPHLHFKIATFYSINGCYSESKTDLTLQRYLAQISADLVESRNHAIAG